MSNKVKKRIGLCSAMVTITTLLLCTGIVKENVKAEENDNNLHRKNN